MGTQRIRPKESLLLIRGKAASLIVRDSVTLSFGAGTGGGFSRSAVYPFTRAARPELNGVFSNFRTRLQEGSKPAASDTLN